MRIIEMRGVYKMGVNILSLIEQGEGIEIEFKESRTQLNADVYESVCAFLNRIGGHILLGVSNSGEIKGIDPSAVEGIKKAFVTTINNPSKIIPTFYTSIEEHVIDGEIVLYIPIPCSSQAHRLGARFFDRNEDADIDISNNVALVADLFNRKANIYSEVKVFPHISCEDIDSARIMNLRERAIAEKKGEKHSWEAINDLELLQSAKLYGTDPVTKEKGMNLAGVLLLGSEQLIISVLPHHRTDAIVRIKNLDRYDDRDFICVNLVESYDRLMTFIKNHVDDPFYLEGEQRISARSRLFREVCSNLLIHREFSNAFPAKLIIEADRIRTENANRPNGYGEINPKNFSPLPKNPIIASVFREIGLADELGSGVRNVNKYIKAYSDEKPQFIEGRTFELILPFESRSSRKSSDRISVGENVGENVGEKRVEIAILDLMRRTPTISANEISKEIGISSRSAERYISMLKKAKAINRIGPARGGHWVVVDNGDTRMKRL